MRYSNSISFRVWGRYALFSDPLTRIGGEKFTYPIPTLSGHKRYIGEHLLEADVYLGTGCDKGNERDRNRVQRRAAYQI